MKKFFKQKKVIVTGGNSFKSTWLKELLNGWGANLVETPAGQSPEELKKMFADEQPEMVFHVSYLPNEGRAGSAEDDILSPYIGTTHVLAAIQGLSSVKSAVVLPAHKPSTEKEWKSGLTDGEKKELADLLERVDNVQIRGEIWHQLVKKFITVPIELCILDSKNRVFLAYRKDQEFDGYHLPGTVINDWETVHEAGIRLMKGEVMRDAGFKITKLEPIGWLEVRRGNGPEESRTRNAVSLLHVAKLVGKFKPKEGMGFFPFNDYPKNTLGHHHFLLRRFAKYVKDKKPVLGK